MFRADLYITMRIADFNLMNSSKKLFSILDGLSILQNVQMTIVRQNKEVHGRMVIREWYEITGSINIPERGNSFWVLSKNSNQEEPYNFFMRIDRNIFAEDYEEAQINASSWVKDTLIEPIKKDFSMQEIEINSPTKLKKQH
ncbi:hypothetical protein LCGC14_1722610 [marine sediment metagenome]|uniref:Uncharacterized protein n=1 Tax=marine sediment metagenome TaxID=412755 RepID=A0A0F9KBP7_9ZZZZ